MNDDLIKARIRKLNDKPWQNNRPVLYVMSRDQRSEDNHALLAAQKHAQAHEVAVYVAFIVYRKTGYRVKQHYEFMFQGLEQVKDKLDSKNIPFIMRLSTNPRNTICELSEELGVGALYFDFNPLRGPRALRQHVSRKLDVAVYEVDTHNIVPLWEASDKEEYAAHTIRRKLHKKFSKYLEEPDILQKQTVETKKITSASFKEARDFIGAPALAEEYKPQFDSGETAAHQRLKDFIKKDLEDYAFERNNPTKDKTTNLSPYLHFGQISSLRVVLELKKKLDQNNLSFHAYDSVKMPNVNEGENKLKSGADALFEEIVVRKELADNYCYYQSKYDSLKGAKEWAAQTLKYHEDDEREKIYTFKELEQAKTHDNAWNAAQLQLVKKGKIHGYMRMYWAKKILEWTNKPATAIEWTIKLNDMYHLDGGDPNGYTGVMWSLAGVHDRPWTEREIFGKIRYMNEKGLKKRFDIEKYAQGLGPS